jgi:hypothetical protein
VKNASTGIDNDYAYATWPVIGGFFLSWQAVKRVIHFDR